MQFPTSQQASEYNELIAPLPAQHQAFNWPGLQQFCNPIKSKSPTIIGLALRSRGLVRNMRFTPVLLNLSL
ncbi:hypothetical protein ACNKHW_22580 [Shigella flexneri]